MPTTALDPHPTFDVTFPPRIDCAVTFIPAQVTYTGAIAPRLPIPAHVCPSCGALQGLRAAERRAGITS